MDLDNIWDSFLSKIKPQIMDILYDTWFSETKLINLNGNIATVLVPYEVHKKHLSENYSDLIEDIFTEITGSNFKFNYVVSEDIENNLEDNNEIIGIENNTSFENNLDSNYTFENFVIGSSNKFAATSALAVAEKPGKMYNPLFIYGSSGLGKTHLMNAIGNYIVKNSNKKVLYITCDNFLDDFRNIYMKSNKENKVDVVKNFKNKYRDVDVLMIDDIHNLVVSASGQQEFFNTFNELYKNQKQIIVSSDRSPDDIKKLEERLKTRFNGGLQVNILPPDFNLRMSILNKKIENNNLEEIVPEDVKEYIASNSTGDVRKLEGALNRVFAYATIMNGSNINLDITIDALKDYFAQTIISQNKMDQVLQIVCDNYNISTEKLLSKKRSNDVAIPRMIAMYICRVYLDENLTKIGIKFGGKNHTTVMHAVEKIKNEILKDENLNNEIQKMIKEIK